MKALSLVGLFSAAFLIFLGFWSRKTAGVLSNALIVGGALIALFVAAVWTMNFIAQGRKR